MLFRSLLYPNCEDGSTKLGTTLELLRWKAECGLTDSSFEKMLKIMKPKFPEHNELLESTYEAKKTLCPCRGSVPTFIQHKVESPVFTMLVPGSIASIHS